MAFLSIGALAGECKRVDVDVAFAEFGQTTLWDAYHAAFVRYGPCSDGVIAGQFTEVASRLLARQWGIVGELAKLGDGDAMFLAFVLDNLGDSVPEDEWKVIKHNAKERCPAGAQKVCDVLLRVP
jgi:hypothetical protein